MLWNTDFPVCTSALVGKEAPLGEYTLNPVEFVGRDRVHVRRLAVNWWYSHRQQLGLCLKEFFLRCRLSADQRTIIFQRT